MGFVFQWQVPGGKNNSAATVSGCVGVPCPCKTAVPFGGQTPEIPSDLSPKRDCRPKWVNTNTYIR